MERVHLASGAVKKKTRAPVLRFGTIQQYLALMFLVVAGAAIGAIYVKHSGITADSLGFGGSGFFLHDIMYRNAASRGFLSLAATAFFPVALLLCVAFLFGLCAVGFAFDGLIPVVHGMWIGVSMACIDMKYGIKGLAICLIFIMPQAIITALAIIVGSREAIRLSLVVYSAVFKEQKPATKPFGRFCFKFSVCFALAAVAALIEALSIIIFSGIFFT